MSIIGNTVGAPNPRPDWNQNDSKKADYIKNKPTELLENADAHMKNKSNPHGVTPAQIGALQEFYFSVKDAGASYQQVIDNWNKIPDKWTFCAYCHGDYAKGSGAGVAFGVKFNWNYGAFLYLSYSLLRPLYVRYSNGTAYITELEDVPQ